MAFAAPVVLLSGIVKLIVPEEKGALEVLEEIPEINGKILPWQMVAVTGVIVGGAGGVLTVTVTGCISVQPAPVVPFI